MLRSPVYGSRVQCPGQAHRRRDVIFSTPARVAAAAAGTLLVPLGVVFGLVAAHHPAPPVTGVVATVATRATPTPVPTPEPTPEPTPTPAPTAPPAVQTGARSASTYTVIGQLDAPSVGVNLPVIAVGVVNGAMDAPEGPLSSPFWHEGFWLREGAVPGTPGTATIAGHLDDTAGRPAAFWNIRNLQVGAEVTITRASDGVVAHYKITETDVWSLSQASTPANIARIYGEGPQDGVARITLITCTGRWLGHEYNQRFVAFGELEG